MRNVQLTRVFIACVLAGCSLFARQVVSAGQDLPTTSPSVEQSKAELTRYDSAFRSKVGDPPAANAAQFIHEICTGRDFNVDRDSRVVHLQNALKLRPDDPANVWIEFYITLELSQHNDPKHNQKARPADGQAAAEHLLTHYDHKAYYRDTPQGGVDSLEFILPRTAIWASGYDSAFVHDPENARKYADMALDDFYWTFQKRRAAWADAPQPATKPVDPMMEALDRGYDGKAELRAWEKRKADAAAGDVLGSDAKYLSVAAVDVYVRAWSEKPEDEADLFKQLMAKYPDTPMAAAAKERLEHPPVVATRPAPHPVEGATDPKAAH